MKFEQKKNHFFSCLKYSSLLTFAGMGIAYLSQVIFARIMGAESYGIYIYIIVCINIACAFVTIGYDSVLLKYLPIYRGEEDWSLYYFLLKKSVTISLLLSFFIASLVISVVLLLDFSEKEFYYSIIIGAFFFPLFVCLKFFQVIFRSIKLIVISISSAQILVPVIATFLPVILYYHKYEVNAPAVLLVHSVSIFFVLSILLPYYKDYIFSYKIIKESLVDNRVKKEWKNNSLSFFFITVSQTILSQTDIIAIGFFCDTTTAGIYTVATRLSALVSIGLTICNLVITPIISEYFHLNKKKSLQGIIRQSSFVSFLSSLIIFSIYLAFGKSILSIFGNEFTGGIISLYILSFGQFINSLFGPVGFMMTMTKHHDEAKKIIGIFSLINIFFNISLIPFWGIIGAAVSTAISTIGWNISLWYFIKKNLRINTLPKIDFKK